jgi:class 3 adenylate cyclase
MLINFIELTNITNKYNITLYYSFADMLSKIMASIIINDYNERELMQINNMDLQSVQFITYLIKYIKKYEHETAIISEQCNNFIKFTANKLLTRIPENKTILEQELLKKILPLDLDKEYIANANANANTNITTNAKQYDMICILFSDIVNYTELAKKYNNEVIFQLLNNIYVAFDKIIKKYPHLQKIETIGDAYMVVGDIFRNDINHKIVIKEIILFAFDIIKEIKTIKTPHKNELLIRIGINMGSVSIGILGNEIPRLCVVGNTVNVASRLQSTAEIDTIQFSRHIYEQLEEIEFDIKFEIIKKENVFLKNLGSVTTYNISPN